MWYGAGPRHIQIGSTSHAIVVLLVCFLADGASLFIKFFGPTGHPLQFLSVPLMLVPHPLDPPFLENSLGFPDAGLMIALASLTIYVVRLEEGKVLFCGG
jgi:hypothetical protein